MNDKLIWQVITTDLTNGEVAQSIWWGCENDAAEGDVDTYAHGAMYMMRPSFDMRWRVKQINPYGNESQEVPKNWTLAW